MMRNPRSDETVTDSEEKFIVREVWFEPVQNGVFSDKPAHIYVLGFPQDKGKTGLAVPLEIPLDVVSIKDGLGKKPTLVLHRRIISGYKSGHSYSGSYVVQGIHRAEFTLPPDMKLLVPRK